MPVAPELIGGLEALQARLRIPEEARELGIEGRVFVLFTVQPDGCPTDLVIARSASALLNAEALRVVAGTRFHPAHLDGQPVAVRYALPVHFRLSE